MVFRKNNVHKVKYQLSDNIDEPRRENNIFRKLNAQCTAKTEKSSKWKASELCHTAYKREESIWTVMNTT